MSQFAWESKDVETAEPLAETQATDSEPTQQSHLSHQSITSQTSASTSQNNQSPNSSLNHSSPQSSPPAKTLALSADEFTALEERVVRAVSLIRRERQARTAAEERANELEAQLKQKSPQVDQLNAEIQQLRGERDEVRQRIERLLTQLDALEL